MSVWGYVDGQRQGKRGVLADGTETEILGTDNNVREITGLLLTNTTGSPTSPKVAIDDGTTEYVVRDGTDSLAANSSELVEMPGGWLTLPRTYTMHITDAANVHWFVSYVIQYKPTGPTDG